MFKYCWIHNAYSIVYVSPELKAARYSKGTLAGKSNACILELISAGPTVQSTIDRAHIVSGSHTWAGPTVQSKLSTINRAHIVSVVLTHVQSHTECSPIDSLDTWGCFVWGASNQILYTMKYFPSSECFMYLHCVVYMLLYHFRIVCYASTYVFRHFGYRY